jgi:hypothetical protein
LISANIADIFALLSFTLAHLERWVSLAKIGLASAHQPPHRTLRDWLAALVLAGALPRRGERKGSRYRSDSRGPPRLASCRRPAAMALRAGPLARATRIT